MKIPMVELLRMYALANVERERLHRVLLAMGRDFLKSKDMEWSPDNCTRNYCYVVSEWLFRFRVPWSEPMGLRIAGDENWHRFIIHPKKGIIDLTCEQFRDYSAVIYANARPMGFQQSGGPQPSKRAQLVEHLYNGGTFLNFHYVNKSEYENR